MLATESTTDSPPHADHLSAIRRLRWIVVVMAVLGAVPGLLNLRSDLSRSHRVVVVAPFRLIQDDSATSGLLGVRSPSQSAAILIRDRSVLAPDSDQVDLVVQGDDDAQRILFSATAGSTEAASKAANDLASAFVKRARTDLQDRVDRLIELEKANIADALKRRTEVAAAPDTNLEDVALTLQIVERTRVLASYENLQNPQRVFGDPVLFDQRTISGSPIGFALAIAGAVFGALLGAVAAAGFGLLDRRLRSRSDLEATAPGVDVLAVASADASGNPFLAAASALQARYSGGAAKLLVVSVGKGVEEAPLVADRLSAGLSVLSDASLSNGIAVTSLTPSLTDDDNGVTSVRQADGIVIVVKSGRTTDAELADAVSTLRLVGTPVVGQVLVGVPKREMTSARAPHRIA